MKKTNILFCLIVVSTISFAQNTIPTTTVNGALEIMDSLKVTKDITAKADMTVIGEMTTGDVLTAQENVIAQKDLRVDGNVFVNHDLNISGKVDSKNGYTFGGTKGLFYTPASGLIGETFQLGESAKLPSYECETPSSEPWNNFYYQGNFVSYLPTGSGTGQTNAAVRLGIAPWNGNALIDVSGVDANGSGTNSLEINTFCKRNTYINMGWDLNPATFKNGGRVYMGAEVQMQRNLKIGYDGLSTLDVNTTIEVNQNENNANAIKVKTWNHSIKSFNVEALDGKSYFTVYGNGRTNIGEKKPLAPHSDAMLSVDGKITAKSLYILKPSSWADFVFKNPNMEPLESIEKFILKNKHLPGLPSEEDVLKNGYDMNEMDAKLLEKIEELYLHIIELEKEIKQLKKK